VSVPGPNLRRACAFAASTLSSNSLTRTSSLSRALEVKCCSGEPMAPLCVREQIVGDLAQQIWLSEIWVTQPLLCGPDCVKHLVAVVGQFIDFGLQLRDTHFVLASLSLGFLYVQISQSLIHIQQERAFLGRKHFAPPISSSLNLDLQTRRMRVPALQRASAVVLNLSQTRFEPSRELGGWAWFGVCRRPLVQIPREKSTGVDD
jgi:hypothetical protein